MPRQKSPPRLVLDRQRRTWTIRDGSHYIRTGRVEANAAGAEKALQAYIASKHQPQRSAAPLIADVLLAYGLEHVPHQRSASKIMHTISNLNKWWGTKKLSDVTARNCRAYAAVRPQAAARRDLETLRAAMGYWDKEYGPLPRVPKVTLPEKSPPRERWLTRSEAARLLWAARRVEHLRRFILIGLYTGSRAGAILGAKWGWIDWENGVMRRRPPGAGENATKRTPPVRINPRLLAPMRRWAISEAPDGYIVNYLDDRVRKLRRSWQAAVARAGLVGKVTPHTLRHTRATWMMQDGIAIWDAAHMLGMSAAVLERTYGHYSPNYQQNVGN